MLLDSKYRVGDRDTEREKWNSLAHCKCFVCYHLPLKIKSTSLLFLVSHSFFFVSFSFSLHWRVILGFSVNTAAVAFKANLWWAFKRDSIVTWIVDFFLSLSFVSYRKTNEIHSLGNFTLAKWRTNYVRLFRYDYVYIFHSSCALKSLGRFWFAS